MPTDALRLLLPWVGLGLLVISSVLVILSAPLLVRLGLLSEGSRLLKRAWRVPAALLALLLLGCALYSRLIEPRWLEVSYQTIASPKILFPVRVLLLSDLHCEGDGLVEQAAREAALLGPDLILLAGDYLDLEEGRQELKEALRSLAGVAPVYAVLGNHDEDGVLDGLPVAVLDGEVLQLSVAGQGVSLGGSAFWRRTDRAALAALREAPGYRIFLHHAPDRVEGASSSGVDLYLAGHTHGGQIALPFYGALVTFATSGKLYESGRHQVGPTTVYVTRGIGTTFFKVRFGARPEITVLDLIPGSHPP